MTTEKGRPTMRRASLLLIVTMLMTVPVLPMAVPASAGEAADANLDVLRDTIRANKKALVAVNLTLTDAEATKFWPIYDRYEGELKAVNDRTVTLVEDYTTHYRELTDEHARKLAEEYLAVEEDRAKVRRTYFAEFIAALPGKKAARFYQIENKMNAVIRYELAKEIPVLEP